MAGGLRTDVHVTGIKELLEGFAHLKGPELVREATKIGGAAARGTFVKAMQQEELRTIKGHGKPNRKDKSGAPYKGMDAKPLDKTITARKARLRSGEMYAWAVGPRKFTRYWVNRGTKPHDITAGGKRGVGGRYIEARGAKALRIGGLYRSGAHHPGARANPFVYRASQNKARDAEREMQKAWDRYVTRSMRRAAAVR